MILLAAAGATLGPAFVLASDAGRRRVGRLIDARHSWSWLAICLVGELAAVVVYRLFDF